MCGIAGVFRHGESDVSDLVNRMMATMVHRGPDSSGRTATPFADVGFRRLSIIDLAGGDQPLANESGSIQCFLNGEIYNYVELKQELAAKGHQFRTTSDTEVLPHLYEEYGTGMFSKLNGMFAICLVDRARQEVLLARDRFGVKQLYYADSPRGLVFGSEIKVILASGAITPEMDEANVLPYLSLFYCPEPHTLVKGVRKLPAGCWMRMEAGKELELHRFYAVPSRAAVLEIGTEEAAQRTRELLWRSVHLQLQADVPVGVSLSGGIDSSAIACAAMDSRSHTRAPLALTIIWPDTDPAEVTSARELCRHLNMPHEVLEIPLGNVFDELPLLGWLSDEPVADPATYSQYCVARTAAKHVKVLLGGAGGDELFGGYGCYGLSRRFAALQALPRPFQRGLRPFLRDDWMDGDALAAIEVYAQSRLSWHSQARSNLRSGERAALLGRLPGARNPFGNFADLFERYRGYDPANQQMIVDFNTYLPEQILTMMDRATMAASIEGRVPFLDNDLVDFAFSLPTSVKMGTPPEAKRVLKRAIAGDVNRSILTRKKAGMPSPFICFLAERVEAVRQILTAPDSYVRSILPLAWLHQITGSPESVRRNFRALYAILVLEIWHKLFIRERLYSKPAVSGAELFQLGHAVVAQ